MSKPIADQWDSYRRDVLPPDAGAVQLSETEMSFYAGAMAAITLISQGARVLPLAQEVAAFTANVRKRG